MTVSTTTIKNSYSGNGSATAFNYTFKIFASAELLVYIRTTATGAETLKTVTTHYTVSGIGDTGGGTVTFTSGNVPTAAQQVILVRATPLTQSTDYVENDPFPAGSHESALDKLTHQMQEQQEELDRSFKVSKTVTDLTSSEVVDDAATRASKILGFSSNGASFAYYDNASTDVEVAAIAGLTSASNKIIRYTGSGTADLIDFLDQDDMSSNSASAVPSQQSVKAYVDTKVTAEDLDVTSDSGTIAIDLDSAVLTIAGGTGLSSAASGTTVTLNIDSTVATLAGTQTLTNKTLTTPKINDSTAITSTGAELNYSDTGAAVGTVVASKVVTADANKDVASFRNITLTGELDAATLDISGNADIDGTTNLDAVDIDGAVQIDGATTFGVDDTGVDVKFFGATSGRYMLWDESADALFLMDGASIKFGTSQDLRIIHDGSHSYIQDQGTGSLFIEGSEVSIRNSGGTEAMATFTPDGAVSLNFDNATKFATHSGGVTVTGELDATTLDISGNADIDGTTNLDAVDVDGPVQIDGATTFGVDDTGVDVKLFGATSGAYLLWDESADKLLTAGGAVVDIVKDKLLIGGTAVTATAAELNILDGVTSTPTELNIIDGGTAASSVTVADADRVVYNDAGTMKQVAVTDLATYFGTATVDQTIKTSDGGVLNLQTSDTTVTDGSILGSIDFKAPDEASGTDAVLLGAQISAVAEGTFASGNNATEMVFKLGASEAASEKMVLSSAGQLKISSDNLLFGTGSKGVYLGVTSATASNLLDDYEEGTWTATMTGSSADPSSAVTVTGNYTKVGNLVYVQANFGGVNTTGASGAIRITGLPFTPSPGSQMSGNISVHTGATIASGVVNISPSFESSYIAFYATKTAAAWAEITHNASGAMWLYFSGTYKV